MEHTGLVLGQPGSLAVHTARERTRLASLRLPLDTSTLLLDWPPTLRHRLAAHGWSIPDEVEDEERVAGLEAALLREGFDPALEPFQLALLPKVDSPCDNPEARTTALTLLQDPSTPFASLSSFLPHLTLVVLSGRSRLRILLKHVDKQLTAISALESIPKRDEAEEEELKELRLRRLTWFWGEVFDENVWESAPLYHHLVITANLPPFKPPPSRPYTFASFITGHYRSRDLSLYRASPLLLNGPKAWGVFRGRVVAGTAARALKLCDAYSEHFDFLRPAAVKRIFTYGNGDVYHSGFWLSIEGTAAFLSRLESYMHITFELVAVLSFAALNPMYLSDTTSLSASTVAAAGRVLAASLRRRLERATNERGFSQAFPHRKTFSTNVIVGVGAGQRDVAMPTWREIKRQVEELAEVLEAGVWAGGVKVEELAASPYLLFPTDLDPPKSSSSSASPSPASRSLSPPSPAAPTTVLTSLSALTHIVWPLHQIIAAHFDPEKHLPARAPLELWFLLRDERRSTAAKTEIRRKHFSREALEPWIASATEERQVLELYEYLGRRHLNLLGELILSLSLPPAFTATFPPEEPHHFLSLLPAWNNLIATASTLFPSFTPRRSPAQLPDSLLHSAVHSWSEKLRDTAPAPADLVGTGSGEEGKDEEVRKGGQGGEEGEVGEEGPQDEDDEMGQVTDGRLAAVLDGAVEEGGDGFEDAADDCGEGADVGEERLDRGWAGSNDEDGRGGIVEEEDGDGGEGEEGERVGQEEEQDGESLADTGDLGDSDGEEWDEDLEEVPVPRVATLGLDDPPSSSRSSAAAASPNAGHSPSSSSSSLPPSSTFNSAFSPSRLDSRRYTSPFTSPGSFCQVGPSSGPLFNPPPLGNSYSPPSPLPLNQQTSPLPQNEETLPLLPTASFYPGSRPADPFAATGWERSNSSALSEKGKGREPRREGEAPAETPAPSTPKRARPRPGALAESPLRETTRARRTPAGMGAQGANDDGSDESELSELGEWSDEFDGRGGKETEDEESEEEKEVKEVKPKKKGSGGKRTQEPKAVSCPSAPDFSHLSPHSRVGEQARRDFIPFLSMLGTTLTRWSSLPSLLLPYFLWSLSVAPSAADTSSRDPTTTLRLLATQPGFLTDVATQMLRSTPPQIDHLLSLPQILDPNEALPFLLSLFTSLLTFERVSTSVRDEKQKGWCRLLDQLSKKSLRGGCFGGDLEEQHRAIASIRFPTK